MINQQLLKPESIVVVGGSNNVHKPGGAIVRNLLQGNYQGALRIINPKEEEVQGRGASSYGHGHFGRSGKVLS